MIPCDNFRNELLPYVFDLLDQTERPRLEQHLESCEACRSALVKVRSQKDLLRRASKASFPGVTFQAPAPVSVILETSDKFSEPSHWKLLAIAASVLIFLGFTAPAAWIKIRSDQIQHQLALVREEEEVAKQTETAHTKARLNTQLQEAMRPDRLAVDFYPEGGTLVTGVPNRVYFQVRDKQGAPADFRGSLIGDGEEAGPAGAASVPTETVVADIRTSNVDGKSLGIGKFTFTPKEARTYILTKIGNEATESYGLPEVQADGVAFSLNGDSFKAGQPVSVTLHSVGKERKLRVAALAQEQVLAEKTVTAAPDKATSVELQSNSPMGGVCRLTVSEEDEAQAGQFEPVAERLFYLQPAEELRVAIDPLADGNNAKLKIESKLENGQPVATTVALNVVDASQDKLAETQLAEQEQGLGGRRAKELEEAIVLLDSSPKAAPALDLQLGANNWRDPDRSNDALAALQGEEESVRSQLKQLEDGTYSLVSVRRFGTEKSKLQQHLARLESFADYPLRLFAIAGLLIVALLLFFTFVLPSVRARSLGLQAGIGIAGTLATATLALLLSWQVDRNLEKFDQPKVRGIARVTPPPAGTVTTAQSPANAAVPGEKVDAESSGRAEARPVASAPAPPAPTDGPAANQNGPTLRTRAFAPMVPAPAVTEESRSGGAQRGAVVPAKPQGQAFGISGGIGGGSGAMAGRAPGLAGAAPTPMMVDSTKKDASLKEQSATDKNAGLDRAARATPAPAAMARSLNKAKQPSDAAPMALKQLAPMSKLPGSVVSSKPEPADVYKEPKTVLELEKSVRDAKGGADSPRGGFMYAVPKPAPDSHALYWNPSLSVPTGKTEISFDLPPSVSRIKITAQARTPDGKVGTIVRTIAVQRADTKELRTK